MLDEMMIKEQTKMANIENGFFVPHFSRQELDRLAFLDDPHKLEGEIALLRVLIRRQFAGPPIDHLRDGGATLHLDVKKLCRYIDTLGRAIKTARLVHDNPGDGMSDELKKILLELDDEAQEEDEKTLAPILRTPGSPRNPGPNMNLCAVRR